MLREIGVLGVAELWFEVYRKQSRELDTFLVRRAFSQQSHTIVVDIFDFARCQASISMKGQMVIGVTEKTPAGGSRNGKLW